MRILMVCLGNICRSPLAEGVMRAKLSSIDHEVDSAGTSSFHQGERPDTRTLRTAKKHKIPMDGIQARAFSTNDFDRFDKIFVMDSSNLNNVLAKARNNNDREKVEMLLNMSHPGKDLEVPDPYYGGEDGFEQVYQLIDEACERIAEKL